MGYPEIRSFSDQSQQLMVVRWGDMSADNQRLDAGITCVACSSIHQTLVAAGTEKGSIGLFINSTSSQESSQRAMLRFAVQDVQYGQKFASVSGLKFLEEHVLVSASKDATIKIWDCTNHSRVSGVLSITSREPVTALTVPRSHGSTLVISGSSGGSVHIRDIRFQSGDTDKGIKARQTSISSLSTTSCPFELISADIGGNIDIWDLRSSTNIPLISLNGSYSGLQTGKVSDFPIASKKRNTIPEELWDVAMGRKRKPDSKTFPDAIISSDVPRQNFEKASSAHSARVIAVAEIDAGVIGSVSVDKSVKMFCKTAGSALGTFSLSNKPLCASFKSGSLCIGARGGFEIVQFIGFKSRSGIRNNDSHVGSVSAVDHAGDWGVCTGGTDRHVFLHRIES